MESDGCGVRLTGMPRVEPLGDGEPLVARVGRKLGLGACALDGVARGANFRRPAAGRPESAPPAHRGCSVMRRPSSQSPPGSLNVPVAREDGRAGTGRLTRGRLAYA